MKSYESMLDYYKKSTPAQKSYFSVGLTLGLLILLVLLIFPAVNHILKLNKEIADGRTVKQKLQEKIVALENAEANYDQLKDRLEIVNEALPTGSEIGQHIKQVEKIATQSKIKIAGIQFSDVPLSKPSENQKLRVKQIDYSITVKGKFSDIQTFLSNLDKLIRTTDIPTISTNEDENTITASINATIYYLGKQSVKTTQTKQ